MKSTRSSDMAVSFPRVSRAWTGREPQTHRPRRGVHEETRNAAVLCKHHAVGESWQVDVAVLRCLSCLCRALRSDRWGVIGGARTAPWDAARGSGTGAARGGSCEVRCVRPVACRPWNLLPARWHRAISRSRRCFHKAGSVSSWVPPVGRRSWGLMPLAARHTVILPISDVLG
jgi:hypothetical protein